MAIDKQDLTRTSKRLFSVAAAILGTLSLMGADGEGCNIEEEPAPPPEEECPAGTHLDVVCDEHNCDPSVPSCYEMCVPDEVCPEGTYEDWICDEYYDDPGYCLDPEGCPPPEVTTECYPVCVPVGVCEPGSHEELICEPVPFKPPPDPGMGGGYPDDGMGGAGGASPDDGMGAGPGDDGMGGYGGGWEDPGYGGEGCYIICVPDSYCPEGTHEEWICEEVVEDCDDPMGCIGECYPVCQPDAPWCPEGTVPYMECDESTGECWESCLPVEPSW